jgi:hypothetical protein
VISAACAIERASGFQRSGERPSSDSVTLRSSVSRGKSVMIWYVRPMPRCGGAGRQPG